MAAIQPGGVSGYPDFSTDTYVAEIRKSYSGPVEIANDLDRY